MRHLRRRRLPFALLVLLPIRQHIADARTVGQLVNFLKVLLGDLEGLGGDVGDIFADQLARVDGGAVDFLEQEGPEGLDAAAEEGAVEGDVDAFERGGGEAALRVDGFGLGFGFLGAAFDDFGEAGFDVFERHFFHEGLDVDFLRFEVVRDAGEGVDGAELGCFY